MFGLRASTVFSAFSVPFTLVSSAPSPVQSDERQKSVCESWRERALDLQGEDRYLAARDALRRCKTESCSLRQRRLCRGAERRLTPRIPRLLVRVHDAHGEVLHHARLFVDGRFAAVGTTVELDPGVHLVRTEEDAHVGRLQRVRLTPGERRVLPVRLRQRRQLADDRIRLLGDRLQALKDERWPMPEAAWTLAGVGVASLASAIVLDAYAADGMDGMRGCAPNCEQAIVDAVEREIQLSRMAAGLSVVSLASAAWFALAESPADAFAPRSSGAPRLRVLGGAGGVRVILRTSFDENLLMQGRNPLGRPPPRIPPPPVPNEVLCSWGCLHDRTPFEF